MATTAVPTELTVEQRELELGSGGPGSGGGDPGGGGGGGRRRQPLPTGAYRLGMTFALASIAMFFMGLTSSYVVRHGLDPDWIAIQMPPILWLNTAILLASSLTFEKARRALRVYGTAGLDAHFKWLTRTLTLGMLFLIGQLLAWRQLLAYGIDLKASGHSSFFYLLTGLHGLHLLGGIVALAYLVWKARRTHAFAVAGPRRPAAPAYSPRAVDVVALYWHSMDLLWVFLMVVLFGELV